MGGNQSARRITIENDTEPSTVIQVSDAVVERLKGGTEGHGQRSVSIAGGDSEKVPRQPLSSAVRKPGVKLSDLSDPDPFPFHTHSLITSTQIRQEIEKEIDKNNQYWQSRIQELQENQDKISRLMDEEYSRAVVEIEKSLPRVPPLDATEPCDNVKNTVLKCYSSHKSQPLLCSKEVEDYMSCMMSTRMRLQNEGKLG